MVWWWVCVCVHPAGQQRCGAEQDSRAQQRPHHQPAECLCGLRLADHRPGVTGTVWDALWGEDIHILDVYTNTQTLILHLHTPNRPISNRGNTREDPRRPIMAYSCPGNRSCHSPSLEPGTFLQSGRWLNGSDLIDLEILSSSLHPPALRFSLSLSLSLSEQEIKHTVSVTTETPRHCYC